MRKKYPISENISFKFGKMCIVALKRIDEEKN